MIGWCGMSLLIIIHIWHPLIETPFKWPCTSSFYHICTESHSNLHWVWLLWYQFQDAFIIVGDCSYTSGAGYYKDSIQNNEYQFAFSTIKLRTKIWSDWATRLNTQHVPTHASAWGYSINNVQGGLRMSCTGTHAQNLI